MRPIPSPKPRPKSFLEEEKALGLHLPRNGVSLLVLHRKGMGRHTPRIKRNKRRPVSRNTGHQKKNENRKLVKKRKDSMGHGIVHRRIGFRAALSCSNGRLSLVQRRFLRHSLYLHRNDADFLPVNKDANIIDLISLHHDVGKGRLAENGSMVRLNGSVRV
jgi:hypothetical protein